MPNIKCHTKILAKSCYFKALTSLLVCLIFSKVVLGQKDTITRDDYIWFDQVTGTENLVLYSGIVYNEKYRMVNEKHKFFQSPDFLRGSIVYKGQHYFDIDLKYDLYEDEVIVKLKTPLILKKEFIDHFFLANKSFITLSDSPYTSGLDGFYEPLITSPNFSFFKKHKKSKTDRTGKRLTYSEFTSENEYYLLFKRTTYKIDNQRDILKVFPEHGKKIKTSIIPSGRRSDKEENLLMLLNRIDEIISTK